MTSYYGENPKRFQTRHVTAHCTTRHATRTDKTTFREFCGFLVQEDNRIDNIESGKPGLICIDTI